MKCKNCGAPRVPTHCEYCGVRDNDVVAYGDALARSEYDRLRYAQRVAAEDAERHRLQTEPWVRMMTRAYGVTA